MDKHDWERLAGELVATEIGGTCDCADPGGPTRRHDCDITLPGGETIALEVTRHNVEDAVRTQAAIDSRDWSFPTLRWHWSLSALPILNVHELHADIERLLHTLETSAIDTVAVHQVLHLRDLDPGDRYGRLDPEERATVQRLDSTKMWPTVERLAQVGVRNAYAVTSAHPDHGSVRVLAYDTRGGPTASSVIVELVEAHARRKAPTLALATTATQRDLFIWVESSTGGAVTAMRFERMLPAGHLPTTRPSLPNVIDVVWVATAYDRSTVRRYSRTTGWQDLGVRDLHTPKPIRPPPTSHKAEKK